MTKAEAKQAFEEMFGRWARERGIPIRPDFQPSFSEFCKWVDQNHYSLYFNFRSTRGSREDVESWFDRYFHQTWRN
jgi:hypothetical protein